MLSTRLCKEALRFHRWFFVFFALAYTATAHAQVLNAANLESLQSGAPWNITTSCGQNSNGLIVANGYAGQYTCAPWITANGPWFYVWDSSTGNNDLAIGVYPGQGSRIDMEDATGDDLVMFTATQTSGGVEILSNTADDTSIFMQSGTGSDNAGLYFYGPNSTPVSIWDDGHGNGHMYLSDSNGSETVLLDGDTGNIVAGGQINGDSIYAIDDLTVQSLGSSPNPICTTTNGKLTHTGCAATIASSNGSTNQVAKFGSSGTLTNSVITDLGSSVAVGAPTVINAGIVPAGASGLIVSGFQQYAQGVSLTVGNTSGVPESGSTTNLLFVGANQPGGYGMIESGGLCWANCGGFLSFQTQTPGGGLAEAMRISSNHDVGIGTTNPQHALEVNVGSSSALDNGILISGASSTFGDIGLHIQNTAGNAWYLDSTGTGSNYGAGKLALVRNSDSPSIVVDGSNVGIATTTPAYNLDVNGTARVSQLFFPDGTSFTTANLPNTGTNSDALLAHPSAEQWVYQPSGTAFHVRGILAAGQNTNGTATIDAFNGDAYFGNNGADPSHGISIDPYARVGIGTGTPQAILDVISAAVPTSPDSYGPYGSGNVVVEASGGRSTTAGAALSFAVSASTGGSSPWEQGRIMATADNVNDGDASGRMQLQTRYYNNNAWQWRNNLTLTSSGNVGVGTTSPSSALEITGNVTLTSGAGGSIKFSDSTVQTTAWNGTLLGGDYAELVDVRNGKSGYDPGDVIAIDPAAPGSFSKVAQPYSTLVAGVYSTKPGAVGRRATAPRPDKAQEVPMAMVGIVPTKVTAENGVIKPGDLLVASSTPGYAMKGTDPTRMQGAIIGKALAGLTTGQGVIEVLITLQ